MSQRIEVNPELSPVVVPARVLNDMRGHALETLPEECCGLLIGASAGRFDEVHRCRNDMTLLHNEDPGRYPRNARHAFHMNEGDQTRILLHAEEAGLKVTGVYHSHVEAGAYFSELDQRFVRAPEFPFPEAVHVVLSLAEARVRAVAAFRWDAVRQQFAGRHVEALPA